MDRDVAIPAPQRNPGGGAERRAGSQCRKSSVSSGQGAAGFPPEHRRNCAGNALGGAQKAGAEEAPLCFAAPPGGAGTAFARRAALAVAFGDQPFGVAPPTGFRTDAARQDAGQGPGWISLWGQVRPRAP